MPDFVKQGESGETKDTTEIVQTPIVEEEPEERKSLYDQLKEDKGMFFIFPIFLFPLFLFPPLTLDRKQEQFRAQFDSQNTGYKLDEKSAKFYEQLLHKKQQEELNQKLLDKNEINRFKQLKQEKSKGLLPTIQIPNKKIIKKNPKKITSKITSKYVKKENEIEGTKIEVNSVVGGYSSDDSE